SDFEKTFGNWSMYNKEFGTITKAKTYPSLFKSNQQYFSSGLNNTFIRSAFAYKAQKLIIYTDSIAASENDSLTCFVNKKNWRIELAQSVKADSTASIKLIKADPNQITLESASNEDYLLVIKQNYYKYWKAAVDGNAAVTIPCNYTFMCIPVVKGKHHISLSYEPGIIKKLSLINLVMFLLLLSFNISTSLKRKTN
ncbi:MAG: YfhO family protein, partial [Sphingobacteriales bacterium]|nr:YfhO family protein [Sphingobacteriales bacterium]